MLLWTSSPSDPTLRLLVTLSMKSKQSSGGLVYSTDSGRMCPGCRRPLTQCGCARQPATPVGDGIVRVSRQSKGRGGKDVTLVSGVVLDAAALERLGKQLKVACGAGGTVKNGVIEVQGDHADRLVGMLLVQGWQARRAGG